MIAFINEHRDTYGVEPICKVLPIAPSTYRLHAARQRDPSLLPDRARRDLVLMEKIKRVFETNYSVYGARKVWRQLRREGEDVARCTVERLMRDLGLAGAIRGKPVKTTVSDKGAACPLDKVNRQFQAPEPNCLWVADFTYVATWAGFVYVAFVIDAFARPDRRMAGEPHGPCNLRSGCPGTGDTCQEARQGIGPRASQRSRCPIRVDQILAAPPNLSPAMSLTLQVRCR